MVYFVMPLLAPASVDRADTGAPESHIETTTAMIDAAMEALRREPFVDLAYDHAVELVKDIIKSALAVSSGETLPRGLQPQQ
jgi:hypothetical protein